MLELNDPGSGAACVDALFARADADFSARRMSDASNAYLTVLAERPHDAHALHRLALASVHLEDMNAAQTYIERAVLAAPERAELWEHAGLIAALKGEPIRAEAFYYRALDLDPDKATLQRNLADCLRSSGRLVEAKAHYAKAVALEPQLHHALRAMARISSKHGQIDDAADYWIRAWTLDSTRPRDGIDLVSALAKARRTPQLDETLAQLRARFAGNANELEALAYVLYKNDRFSDALSVARQGLAIYPASARLHHYAALALSVPGNIVESLPHSMEATRLWPDSPEMQYHLACVQLACGKFKEGWARHKAYYALPGSKASLLIPLDFPEWNGEPVAGCQFLLVGEQGDGDKIQCIRFAEWLHRQGATVDLVVPTPVAQVAATMRCIRAVYSSETPPGPYDYWTHLLKIPEHMGLDLSMLPGIEIPYVFATPKKVHRWRTHIEALSPVSIDARRRRIGVVWAGRPAYAFDRFRSIPLDMLKPLFGLPGTAWFSVQKGERERESEALAEEFDLHTLGPSIEDFTDTLAILETLDLVITVDTSVAHLAGAAGRPVWVLVPAYVEWRWLNGRTDSPWYPSMRLFRQRELREWNPVIEEVRGALHDWLSEFG
jgi:tetratricopeptide (TPR) repeat protein